MTHSEACQLFIEQEIKEGLAQGKTPYSIGKELTAMVEKMFEVTIPADTLRKRAGRIGTNVHTPATPLTPSEIPEKPVNQQVRNEAGAFVEGTAPGPGRPPKYQYPQEPWSCAMSMAGLAIGHLGRIPDDDPKRHEAFQKVIAWINDHS